MAVLTRVLRTDMIATLQEDHVLLAKAKGLSTARILFRHALRPSSFSLLTVVGIQVGALLGGALIVEQIFALPGLGRLIIDSVFQRDFMIVQGGVLLTSVIYVVVNAAVDVLYTFLDPRIRYGGTRNA
jgi:peptide/nickel transport system permease protein